MCAYESVRNRHLVIVMKLLLLLKPMKEKAINHGSGENIVVQ